MKSVTSSFSEIFFIDATYKLNDLGIPLYIFMVEDSMGCTEVAGVGLLVAENEESLKWLMETFMKNNNKCSPSVIMADKDMTFRRVIKELYPDCKLLICLFHALRSFKREICNTAFNLNVGQQAVFKEIFQKMCYSRSEVKYMEQYNLFLKTAPEMVKEYFVENWHDIRDEWVLGHVLSVNSLYNTTNNRIESFNGKLKSVIKLHSPLQELIDGFFTVLYALRNERNNKAAMSLLKRKVTSFSPTSSQYHYMVLLTSYGSNFVIRQLDDMKKIGNIVKKDAHYEFREEPEITATSSTCTCSFQTSLQLPCRHIFVVRESEGLPLFCKELCAERWTKTYYRQHQRMFAPESINSPPINILVKENRRRVLNQNERFRNVTTLSKRLIQLVSCEGMRVYNKKMDVLKRLINLWESDIDVEIVEARGY